MNKTLRDGIDWVGYVDWTVRDFHGYNTDRGTTYNAYLVRDQRNALIDTVKAEYADRLLEQVAALVPPASVHYIVCNHAEPDHAGSLARVMAACPNATLVCNRKCRDALSKHFDIDAWKIQIVSNGETLSLGRRTLHFIDTPMAHWPESMMTYVPEDRLLFSMDVFGQHFAGAGYFDDDLKLPTVMAEARSYYANILMGYAKPVADVFRRTSGLEIRMIAPSHGVIWRSHVGSILSAYKDWIACRPKPKVLAIYDTMWGATARMAEAIIEGATVDGVEARLIAVRASTLAEIAAETLDAAAIAFGSSTLNAAMMPMMAATLTYLKGLRPMGKAGFAFGSYGWGKHGPQAVHDAMQQMAVDILRPPLMVQYRPKADALAECRAAGKMLAEKAVELASRADVIRADAAPS